MRMLVLGAGVSGTAAARLADRIGHRVVVYERDETRAERLAAAGFVVVSGEWTTALLDGIDVVVTSPGFAEWSPPLVDAASAGVEVWSEVEFAFRHIDRPVVAVTGTNGKTTVTELISSMLEAEGYEAPPFGNIGTPLSQAVDAVLDVAVVEVSSFQLRFVDTFRPRVAVVTNVAADHLDWHRTVDAYRRAKARIFERQGPGDDLVYDATDEGATTLVGSARARRWPVVSDAGEGRWGVGGGMLRFPGGELPLAEVAVADPTFLTDLALAAVAATRLGVRAEPIAEVASRFRPAPHRRTEVARWRDVTFVDDSKATNPHAALAAIDALAPVVLIAGGQAKGLDLRPLVAHRGVRRVVAIGEAAASLQEMDPRKVVRAPDLTTAVREAAEAANPGDTVLLAPGCASFDMFGSYVERGEAFAEAVSTLMHEEVAR